MDNERRLTAGLPVIVVLGATATGKTALAVELATAFDGEVVSADSRYFYRGMDIGTAKPDERERGGIPHHLIDIREPWEPYSLASFLDDAYAAVEEIGRRGRLPLVAGGTPQYLRALLEGWTAPQAPPDATLRAALDKLDPQALHDRLRAVDPVSAGRIETRNKRRLIRALEIFETLGRPMSDVAGRSRPPYRFLVIGLTQERQRLYQRIDQRVAEMHASGWVDETRQLQRRGVTADMPAMSAHGYREALEVVNGACTIEDAIERTRFMIHRYVRHQQTWFRRFEDVRWFDSSKPDYSPSVVEEARAFLATASGK
ncbi:MAG TPA: tRNA (adenosine(37)-N6)-dimethylallyltransferase MiaA [Thermomicrobiales bacterium]|nr:tRNA (adenosine(37)-N6)-dimethylallyltransferase MiaA [Thermomicrobiales bacterium]